jgi:hypothetical protein
LVPTHSAEMSPERGHFAALCRQFLAGEYAAAPVMASGLGLTEFDARLDDLSEAAFEERRRWSAHWRERFRALPDAGLGTDERIDRDFVVSILTGRGIKRDTGAGRRDAPRPRVGSGRSVYTGARATGRRRTDAPRRRSPVSGGGRNP